MEQPRCHCGLSCVALQVKKDGPNRHRWFWKCPQQPPQQCKIFMFVADPSFRPPPQSPASGQQYNSYSSGLVPSPGGMPSPRTGYGSPGGAFGSPRGNGAGGPWHTSSARMHDLTGEPSPGQGRPSAQGKQPVITVLNSQNMPGWFSLSFAYNEGMKDTIKSLPGSQRRYNPDSRSWDVHPNSYDAIIAQLQLFPHHAVVQSNIEDTSSRQFGSQGDPSSQGAGPSTPPQSGLKITIQYPTASCFTVQFGQAAHGACDAFEAALNIVRSLPSRQRSYNKDSKCWTIDRDVQEEVLQAFRQPPVSAQLEMPPQWVSDIMQEPEQDSAEADERIHSALPHDAWQRLFPFQREGVLFGVKRQGRCMIADEMGLGKTVQAVLIAACFSEDWPLLIICPSSLRYVWRDELLEWLPDSLKTASDHLIVIDAGKDIAGKLQPCIAQRANHLVAIISYDLAQQLKPPMTAAFNFIICDESHSLKSPTAKRTLYITPLVRKAKRAILISGTPMKSIPIELHTQVDMLRPGLLGTRDQFGQRYCGGVKTQVAPMVFEYRGKSNLMELSAVLEKSVHIRRLKADVLDQLPHKQRSVKRVPLGGSFVQEAQQLQMQIDAVRMDSSLTDNAREAQLRPLHTRLHILAGKAKVDESAKRAISLTESGKKVLVFGHHQEVLNGLQDKFAKEQIGLVRIDGSTDTARRNAAAKQFQSDGKIMVALLSITAAGQGLTLTAAQAVIFAELLYTPGELIQAEDRAHRIGQTRGLSIYYLLALGTNDEMVWRNVKDKLHNIGQTMDGHMYGTAIGLDTSPAARQTQPTSHAVQASQPSQAGGSQLHHGTGVFAEVSSNEQDDAEEEEEALIALLSSPATIPGSSQQHFAGTPTTLNLISQPSPLAHPASSSQGRIAPADMQPRPSCAEAPDAQPATQPWEEAVHDEHKEHQPQGAAKRRRSQSGPVIDLCQDAEVSHSGSQAQRRRRRRHTLSQGGPTKLPVIEIE